MEVENEELFAAEDPSLLPGENPDLKAAIIETVGPEWLVESNIRLAGLKPIQLIGTRNEYRVRSVLRSYLVAGLS